MVDWFYFQLVNVDKIIYGVVGLVGKEFCLFVFFLFFEKGIYLQWVDICYFEGCFVGFFVFGKVNVMLFFDLLVFIFYLVVCYEEYLFFEGDVYGWFLVIGSLAYQYGFL